MKIDKKQAREEICSDLIGLIKVDGNVFMIWLKEGLDKPEQYAGKFAWCNHWQS